ncbi:hypothetical protein DSM104299_02846 [Baekduia alba]|nr:hypothetical protein DSM104299_02846 [Baekduia alba]
MALGAVGAPAVPAAQPKPVGTILVADLEANRLVAVDPATGAQSVVAEGGPFVDPEGLVVDPATCDAIVSDAGAAKIFRVSLADGTITTIAGGPPLVHPVGGVLDEQGRLLSSDEEALGGSGGVIRVDLRSGEQTVVAGGGSFVTPLGVALAPDGRTFVADADAFADTRGGVIAVDRASGAQTVVSQDPGPGQHPQGILWHDGRLLLTDMQRGGLFTVDPASPGVQTPVVVGHGLQTPREIEGDGPGRALIADAGAKSVFRVDLGTGAVQTVTSGGLLMTPFGIATVPTCPDRPAPAPAPPAAGVVPPPARSPVMDTTAPRVTIVSAPGKARRASLVRGIALRLSVSEPAKVRVELRRPSHGRRPGSRLGPSVTLRRTRLGAFTVRVTATSAALRRLLRTGSRLTVRIVVADTAGNVTVRERRLSVSK